MPSWETNSVLVTATTIEARFLLEKMPQVHFHCERRKEHLLYVGRYNNLKIAVVITGMGPENGKNGLTEALNDLSAVESVVGFGFASGLIKTAQAGNLVIPTMIHYGQTIETPTEWLRMGLASHADHTTLRKLITVEKVISSPVEKAALYAATEAQALDMESAVWGRVCREKGVPWAIVRTILDPADQVLPEELAQTVDSFGRVRWLSALGLFASRPKLLGAAFALRVGNLRKLSEPYVDILVERLAFQSKNRSERSHHPTVESKVAQPS